MWVCKWVQTRYAHDRRDAGIILLGFARPLLFPNLILLAMIGCTGPTEPLS